MKVYLVLFDWSTADNVGVEVEVFDSFDKALYRYNAIIEDENDADLSWVGEEVFDENGDINENFELDTFYDETGEHELWWNVTDTNDWNRHDFLDLRILEVQ
ncbi:MAG: hypothetical protein RSB09_03015 [Clostridia bacterium]